ncbi:MULTISPECIES: hypothetical protein [unclassified Enterococcus]|uniref:hypothetical protein n=1 Tax=unclassified Enterococcus TaxID=2608891 RepID=UPI003F205A6E
MEIVQLIAVEGTILTFEDNQGRKIVFPVDSELAEEYEKVLNDQTEAYEPLLFERSQMEALRR